MFAKARERDGRAIVGSCFCSKSYAAVCFYIDISVRALRDAAASFLNTIGIVSVDWIIEHKPARFDK